MKRSATLCVAALVTMLAITTAHAADQVKTADRTVVGTIKSVDALKVAVEDRNGKQTDIPAGQIEWITFDKQPAALSTARTALSAGRYEDVVEALSGTNAAEIARRPVAQDVEYYRLYSLAQMALVGNGNIADVGSKVYAFINANKDSYHYLDAQMLFGDLAGAAGKPDVAQSAYRTVGQMAPWPNYRARAAVALGRSYLAQNKMADASASFKIALDTPDTAPGVQAYKLAATLGEARCLAAAGQQETALDMIEKVIAQADSENYDLLAQAYNARGASYRASKLPKDALLAYLTVHLVYFNSPQNHIEALQNLVELWNEVQKPERSAEAARILRDRYKRSPR